MTERYEVYKCGICGNIVEMLHSGAGQLVCCGEPMNLFTENTVDASKEKHVPVMENTQQGVLVKVGNVPHPMEEKHHIELVEIVTEDGVCRRYLKPGEEPRALFECQKKMLKAREYCNIHGLWSAKP
ncbi:MAG: desulfoferrodoxin [Thermoplasmata archaeon HGW-Thermoplasmata-1]|nr:MAG: desulfoferrodoxin [Thermoplasmata archaeon HGW-Thermoplasmata-1]